MTPCPHCGHPMHEIRCGAQLTPLKARIFDLVKRAGPDGIENKALYDMAFANELPKQRTRKTIKAHVWQINALIGVAGFRIRGWGGVYRLERWSMPENVEAAE